VKCVSGGPFRWRRYSGPEFASIVVKMSETGRAVTLGDVAEISDGFSEEDLYATFNGSPCAMVDVLKSPGEDSIAISRAVGAYFEEFSQELPEGVRGTQCFDSTKFIDRQIAVLGTNGLIVLALVLVILWIFLEPRLGFWVAMNIPTSLAGSSFFFGCPARASIKCRWWR